MTGLQARSERKVYPRYVAVIVGAILGHLAGGGSEVLAKIVLSVTGGGNPTLGRLAEASLHLVLLLTALGVCAGVLGVLHDAIGLQDIVTATVLAVFIAFMAMMNYGIAEPGGSVVLPPWNPLYYLAWLLVFWFLPFGLLPTSRPRVQRGCEVLLVTAAMMLAGVFAGLVLEGVSKGFLLALKAWTGFEIVKDPRYFWVALPATLNAIVGAYVGVAFLELWWPGCWSSRLAAWLWTAGVSAFTVLYAGVYGLVFFDGAADAGEWRAFLSFAGVGLTPLLAVVSALFLARLAPGVRRERVAESKAFWWCLAGGLSGSFALMAWLGLAPLAETAPLSTWALTALVVAHFVNGAVMSVTLLLVLRVIRWLYPSADGESDWIAPSSA